jgi:hypothetical protein
MNMDRFFALRSKEDNTKFFAGFHYRQGKLQVEWVHSNVGFFAPMMLTQKNPVTVKDIESQGHQVEWVTVLVQPGA